MQDQAAVKDYITKYKLEDELSNAVNLAIKQQSEDPYLVIADYMKQLSTTDDYDEDEEEVMDEQEEMKIPPMKARGRRDQVMASKVEIPADWKPKVVPKDDGIQEFLKGVMDTNKLMKNLTPSDRQQLMLAFDKKSFSKGETIIKQGEAGDNFYIVYSGECDISVSGVGSVMKASPGIAFGELALLHNAPRAATVTVESESCETYYIDMIQFKSIMMGKSQQDHLDYMRFLDSVKILESLSKEMKTSMAGSLKEKEYPAGSNIICEGDEGNDFYIVREGEVKCTKVGQSQEVSRRLTRGDFFGELALISSDKRAATVSAVTPTTVLVLTRLSFERILGPLKDIMGEEASLQARA